MASNLQTPIWLIEEKIAEYYQCKLTLEEALAAILKQANNGLGLIAENPEVAEALESIRSVRRTPIRGADYRKHLKKLLEAYSLSEICKRMCLTEHELMLRCVED